MNKPTEQTLKYYNLYSVIAYLNNTEDKLGDEFENIFFGFHTKGNDVYAKFYYWFGEYKDETNKTMRKVCDIMNWKPDGDEIEVIFWVSW